jgi:heme-degrading monooxygenase HmoA
MYGRMATYTFSGDAHDLARRAEQSMLPIFQAQPGFQAYSLAVADGQILSLSVWGSRSDAEAGSAAAASWVADNMAGELELLDVRYAEVLLSTSLGVSTLAGASA